MGCFCDSEVVDVGDRGLGDLVVKVTNKAARDRGRLRIRDTSKLPQGAADQLLSVEGTTEGLSRLMTSSPSAMVVDRPMQAVGTLVVVDRGP